MRFFSIHRELDSIRRQLRLGNRQVRQEQLQQYAVDGTLPTDALTLAYVNLAQAALDAMNSSVGGGDHEAACERYSVALSDWQRASRGA